MHIYLYINQVVIYFDIYCCIWMVFFDIAKDKSAKMKTIILTDHEAEQPMPDNDGCIGCGDIDVPLYDGWCEQCWREIDYEEARKRAEEYAERLAAERYRDRYK